MHHERWEVVGEAGGRSLIARFAQVIDQYLQAACAVGRAGRFIQGACQ